MAVFACAIAQAIANRGDAVAQRFLDVAARARDLLVFGDEREGGGFVVIELIADLKSADVSGLVATRAIPHRFRQAELAAVNVFVTALALARNAAVRSRRRAGFLFAVARAACGSLVRTEQRPGRVIDVRLVPIGRRVTLGAAALRHLFRKLITVRVGVAVRANFFGDP